MNDTLPAPVQRYLGDFVARRRRVLALRSVGLAIAFLLLWMLLICAIDRIAPLNRSTRWLALSGGMVASLALLARPLCRALRRRFNPVTAARAIERFNPGFEQRLITLVSQASAAPAIRGSRQLLDHLAAQVASAMAPPAVVAARGTVARPWLGAAGVALLTILLAALPGLGMPRLMARFLKPWAPLPAVTANTLVVQPGTANVIDGRSEVVTVAVQPPTIAPPLIHLSDDGRTWATFPMTPGGSGTFAHRLAAVDRDLRYYITGGDAVSPTFTMSVLRIPAVERFSIHLVYPSYTRLPPAHISNTSGLIEAPVGTEALVTIRATQPLEDATLSVGAARIATTTTADPSVREARFTLVRDEPCTLQLVGRNGVSGEGPKTMSVRAIPDRPPVARISGPANRMRIAPGEVFTMQFQTADDYGVSSASVYLQRNSESPATRPLAVASDKRAQRVSTEIDTNALSARAGDVISLWAEAVDANGARSRSDVEQVLVSSSAIGLHGRNRLAAMTAALQLAEALKAALDDGSEALTNAGSASLATRRLATATEAATMLRLNLLRAIVHSASPQQSTALANLLDAAESCSLAIDAVKRSGAGIGEAAQAGRLLDRLRLLTGAEQAAALLADRQGLAGLPTDVLSAAPWRGVASEIEAALGAMSLDPRAADLEAILQQRVSAGDRLIEAEKPIDFAAAARQWIGGLDQAGARPMALDRRLVAAAQAEALRPDADAAWAHDLHLAAAAATKLAAPEARSVASTRPSDDPRQAYPAALTALARGHGRRMASIAGEVPDAEVGAREQMRRWAGEEDSQSIDDPNDASRPLDLALTANALMVQGQFEQARRLDETRERITQTSSAVDATLGPSPGEVMARAQFLAALGVEQEQLAKSIGPAGQGAKQLELAVRIERALADGETGDRARSWMRHPAAMATAGSAAKLAAAALSANLADARRHQREAAIALAQAAREAMQVAASRRLACVPALAWVFADYPVWRVAPELVAASKKDQPRRDPIPMNAPGIDHAPPGYEESLKTYFEVLSRGTTPESKGER